jgi:hypothetical protein
MPRKILCNIWKGQNLLASIGPRPPPTLFIAHTHDKQGMVPVPETSRYEIHSLPNVSSMHFKGNRMEVVCTHELHSFHDANTRLVTNARTGKLATMARHHVLAIAEKLSAHGLFL